MALDKLRILKRPKLCEPRMLLGFSGWMDAGEVSSGTVNSLIDRLDTVKFAEIASDGFYICSFPGPMEMTALFRPHTKIVDGVVKSFEVARNEFYYSSEHNLILFLGKEPNLHWPDFADCIFSVCSQFGVSTVYFAGSIAGLVPHTREPKLFCSLSDENLKDNLQHYGVNFANYEGPASIVTYLTVNASSHGLGMANFVTTVPAYVQGSNPKCIETMARRLSGILDVHVELDDLRLMSDEFEKKLGEVVKDQPELAENIQKLEEDYDNEIFNHEMGDLKDWLEQQGIRLD